MNLLEETKVILKAHNKTLDNIMWIRLSDGYITLETFKKLANVDYDNGYGVPEVNTSLIIIGDDFYMTRGEYDGSEWWEYYSMDMFKKPLKELKPKSLVYE